jgi:hypothetical protein
MSEKKYARFPFGNERISFPRGSTGSERTFLEEYGV